jgi:DNA-binding IclR family transcriptional regulator
MVGQSPAAAGTGSRVPAAERTLAILRHLASQPRPVPAAAIARDLGLPRSTTYHLLAVLERERFVTRLPEERRWALGVGAFEVGSAYLRHESMVRLARPVLSRLVDEVAENGHLAVLDGREVLYLVEERASGGDLLVTDVDVRLPAHLTASGRSLLAFLPPPQRTALYPTRASLSRRTQVGPTRLGELRDLLAEVERRGWADEDGEVTAGFASVGAPAFDHAGRPAAALAVTFRSQRRDAAARAELADAVLAAAAELTRRFGGAPPRP